MEQRPSGRRGGARRGDDVVDFLPPNFEYNQKNGVRGKGYFNTDSGWMAQNLNQAWDYHNGLISKDDTRNQKTVDTNGLIRMFETSVLGKRPNELLRELENDYLGEGYSYNPRLPWPPLPRAFENPTPLYYQHIYNAEEEEIKEIAEELAKDGELNWSDFLNR